MKTCRSAKGSLGLVLVFGLVPSACATPHVDAPSGSMSGNIITAADIENFSTGVSLEQILERHVPGLGLRGDREPGGGMTMHVLGSDGPLFVVDGVPIDTSFSALGLNPRDIAWIEVRKHGSTAEFGLRGSNGVILISTRSR